MEVRREPLIGRVVRLDPITEADREGVRELLDRDEDHWRINLTQGSGEGFDAWWAGAMQGAAKSGWITYAMRRHGETAVVGTSSYLNVEPAHGVVEIGATFLHPDVRGGAVNPEAKRLMLAHAFDVGARRVAFSVDARYARSRAAVLKLGAQQEGVLRRHRTTWTGHVRDTVVFSITDLDWPAVRDGLDARLAALA
jgi:RimJ/RimL family protein N-acetyltransferase